MDNSLRKHACITVPNVPCLWLDESFSNNIRTRGGHEIVAGKEGQGMDVFPPSGQELNAEEYPKTSISLSGEAIRER